MDALDLFSEWKARVSKPLQVFKGELRGKELLLSSAGR